MSLHDRMLVRRQDLGGDLSQIATLLAFDHDPVQLRVDREVLRDCQKHPFSRGAAELFSHLSAKKGFAESTIAAHARLAA